MAHWRDCGSGTRHWERTAFLIDRDTPGLAVQPEPETTALRTAPSGGVRVVRGDETGQEVSVVGFVGAPPGK
jgi:hypothetical protein